MPARRRLITDTFKVVKKAKNEDTHRKKAPPSPEPGEIKQQASEFDKG